MTQSQEAKIGHWLTAIGWVLVVIIATVCAIQARQREVKDLMLAHPLDINDFNRWLRMLPGFLSGHQKFTNDLWPMPPFTIVLFSPFSLLSFPNAQFAWAFVKPALIAIIFYCAWGLVKRGGGKIAPLPMVLILLIWFFPVIGDLQEGQVNLLMLTPLAVGLWCFGRDDKFSPWLGGLMIGMAVAIKVTPIIFVIYFLWRRRWTGALAILLGTVFWLYAPLTLFFGWAQSVAWNHQYYDVMIRPYLFHNAVKVPSGESIPSFLYRLLVHSPAFVTYHHSVAKSYYVNFMNLKPLAAERVVRIVLTAIGLIGLFWMRRKLPTLRSRRYLMEVGAIGVFMLWAEEWSWVPHYVLFIFPLMAVGMLASDSDNSAASRKRATTALVAAAVLMIFTSDAVKVFGPHASNWGRVADPVLFAGIALMLALFTAGYRNRSEYLSGPVFSGGMLAGPGPGAESAGATSASATAPAPAAAPAPAPPDVPQAGRPAPSKLEREGGNQQS